jgi:hypothetical protein
MDGDGDRKDDGISKGLRRDVETPWLASKSRGAAGILTTSIFFFYPGFVMTNFWDDIRA